MMMLAVDIQHCDINRSFDYVACIAKEMYKQLIDLKDPKDSLYFKWYSLLMHMILYSGSNIWTRPLNLKTHDEEGKNC